MIRDILTNLVLRCLIVVLPGYHHCLQSLGSSVDEGVSIPELVQILTNLIVQELLSVDFVQVLSDS